VSICQPASGCRVNGDLCREDSDCCGAAGTGLPGDGNVVCDKPSNAEIGVCRNPTGCNPQGNVCHYKNYACAISSARNDCCGCIASKDCCQLDALGVPRCNALGNACRKAGDTCASADDCCNHAPCVADASGTLHCYASPCVPAGGSCSINGDCCAGSTCVEPQGSTKGTCSAPPPPGTGGYGGATGSGGAGGACAQYGQMCTSASDCCGGVPCTNGICTVVLR
jgi:hypothetical protein